MSSKVNLLKKKHRSLSSKLNSKSKVEMANKNANASDGTLSIRMRKEKNILKQTPSKVIDRPKVIGNINEIKVNKVIKRPEIIANTVEPKANRVIKTPKEVRVDDKRKIYVNPITLKYVLDQPT